MNRAVFVVGVLLAGYVINVTAQPFQADNLRVVERGPHHAKVEWTRAFTDGQGQTVLKTNKYTTLETGMNRLDASGQWTEANEKIEILPDCAVARGGQHQVVFQGDIEVGAPALTMPSGQQIRSRVLGLAYWDTAKNESVMIAGVKSSQGELLASGNEVLYRDCFDGDGISGSLLYTYTKAGFVQDIILDEQLPSPEEWGLNPASTVVECLTEFFDAPEPKIKQLNNDDGDDTVLDFGAMKMIPGKAFPVGEQSDSIPVKKQWLRHQGRDILIEHIEFDAVEPHLSRLPNTPQAGVLAPRRNAAVSGQAIPASRRASLKSMQAKTLRLASAARPVTGMVLDYEIVNTASNFTFLGDTTYYVTGAVALSGTTVLEGGAVIKFATNHSSISIYGPVSCMSTNYRPAAFTAQDDDSVGETISGSTGSPSGYYGGTVLNFVSATNQLALHNIRIAYAQNAIAINGGSGHQLTHIQLHNCGNGIAATNTGISLNNALEYRVATNFSGSNSTVTVSQLTVDAANVFNTNVALSVYNTLLVAVTNFNAFTSNTVYCSAGASGVFKSVGAGQHYLSTNSPYRNIGPTNYLASDFVSALRTRTTYPPYVYFNVTVSSPLVLGAVVSRDTTTNLDLGYHYEALDYAFGGVKANADITFTNGAAVGWFRTSSGWEMLAGHGITMTNSRTVSLLGTATSPVYWVRCNTVQEGANGLWCGGYGPGGITGSGTSAAAAPTVVARFARCSMMEWAANNHFRDDKGYINENLAHCEFYGACLGGYRQSMNVTNCLFARVILGLTEGRSDTHMTLLNCTMKGACITINRSYATPVTIHNCAFDGATMNTSDSYNLNSCTSYNYNAFTTGYETTPAGANDVIVTNFNWQTGPLGLFYQPTNSSLINAGDRNATNIGLYHFTANINLAKETNSIVDIGYHYVATDANGNPLDTDGDGIPDYIEDANGNGIGSDDNFDWTTTLTGPIPDALAWAQGLSPRSAAANDLSNLINMRVYTPLR